MKLFSRMLGRGLRALVAALVIAFYTLLVGAGAFEVRAAIMGGLGLFARQGGRRQEWLDRHTTDSEQMWAEVERR